MLYGWPFGGGAESSSACCSWRSGCPNIFKAFGCTEVDFGSCLSGKVQASARARLQQEQRVAVQVIEVAQPQGPRESVGLGPKYLLHFSVRSTPRSWLLAVRSGR